MYIKCIKFGEKKKLSVIYILNKLIYLPDKCRHPHPVYLLWKPQGDFHNSADDVVFLQRFF